MEKLKPSSAALSEFSKLFCNIPFNRTLGAELIAIEDDHLAMQFKMKEELIGNFLHGILHGGVISSVLDTVGGAAVLVHALQKHPNKDLAELKAILSKTGTVDLHVHFIRPGKGEHFIAKAWVTHSGNKISFTHMELYNQDLTLLASGSATYLLG